ncbi:MAG: MBL fold metallo-hydrolase [Fimbriimonadaceae bacterium]|nr:MBL fold metallo-hydrolase [Fimbriimonadaceae bacterium]
MFAKLRFAAILLVAVIAGFWLGWRPSSPKPTRLIFFSVGQGDCALFQHDGLNILIDAGPANEYSDAGRTLLYPQLRDLGVNRIDLVLLSHPDNDHIGGLVSLSKRIEVRVVAVPRHFKEHKTLQDVLSRSRISDRNILWIARSMQMQSGEWQLRFVSPSFDQGDNDNQGSMFVWLGNGKSSAVFSGDADMFTEATMLKRGNWKAQVMKGGHHGSKFSTGPEWLKAVQPRYVIFTCGRNNSYGHPSAEAVTRAEKAGAKVLRTDRDGTITFEAGERGFEIVGR